MRTETNMKTLIAGALVAALFSILFLLAWMALSVPLVEWSWSTQECVRVIPPEAGACDQLPTRYERVWVR